MLYKNIGTQNLTLRKIKTIYMRISNRASIRIGNLTNTPSVHENPNKKDITKF